MEIIFIGFIGNAEPTDVCDEIASLLVPRPSETTLRNWASGNVYGPADRDVFDALIDVLVENKTLASEAAG